MDKEQASNYVINRLMKGYHRNTIIAELSVELHAPIELVSNFVDKVSESFTASQDFKDSLPIEIQADNRNKRKIDISSKADASGEDEKPGNVGKRSSLRKKKGNSPLEGNMDSESSSDYNPPDKSGQHHDFDLEAVNGFVIKSIKNHHRHNDIVAAVCSRTKMDWNEAQRLVASIQTQNYEELSTSNRTTEMWLSMVFIFGGILLLGWSLSGVVYMIKALTGLQPSDLPSEFLVWQVGGFVISLGIIAGGIFGFYRSLSNQ